MTLALYGKSKKRQGSLLLAALLAILVASVGALATITSTFAHHLEGSQQLPTCANNQAWSLTVTEGSWSGYREAVLTITDATTDIGPMEFTPYIADGSGSGVILTANGVGTVHTAGNVKLYGGSFGPAGFTDTSSDNINNSITSLVHSGGTAWDADFTAGKVMLWGSELMKITARSGDGKTLTVERGFGDSSPNAQTANAQSLWVRGAAETDSNDTRSWDIDYDVVSCTKTIIVKKVTVGDPGATSFSTDINNTDGGEGDQSNKSFSVASPYTNTFSGGENGDDFTVSEDTPPANWALTGKKILNGNATCPAADGSWDAAGTASGSYLDDLAVGETVTVCFRNTYTPPGELTVTKTAVGGITSTTDPAAVKWDITFYNSTNDYRTIGITDANVTVVGAPVFTDNNNDVLFGDPNCSGIADGGTLSPEKECNLPHHTGVKITVKPSTLPVRTCSDQTFANQVSWRQHTWNFLTPNAWSASANAPANPVTIVLEGDLTLCEATITWTKSGQFNPSVGDQHIDWIITITNSSAYAGNITIYDPNTSWVNDTCSNNVTESPADTYYCEVPANTQIQLILRFATITGANLVCDNYVANNTAVNASDQNDSQTAQVTHYATPDKSCISVTKDKSQTSEPPTWNIGITNTADVAMGLYIQDSDAFLNQVVSGGTCEPGDTILGNGLLCQVNANSTLILSVYKAYPTVATCEGTDVSNTVKVWVGTFTAPPSDPSDFTVNGGTFEDLNKDTSLCNKYIEVRKYFHNLNGYAPVAGDLPTFKLSPNPWGAGDYTITDDTHCDISGTNPVAWTCSVPAAWVGTASETVPANWVRVYTGFCEEDEGSLFREVTGLVREVLSVVEETPVIKLSHLFVFCNAPTANIKIIKTDLTSGANTGLPADWDFTYSGTSSGGGSIALGGGELNYTVPLGTYSAAETNGHYGQCPGAGSTPGINDYFTTDVQAGPLSHTAPGQTLTFAFRNEDCGRVLGTGTLVVFKVRDENGNHTLDGADSQIVWKVVITGPEFPGGQDFDVPNSGLILNGILEGVYTVKEYTDGDYKVVGVQSTETPFVALGTTTQVTLNDGETDTVIFYNQPLGNIRAHKFAYTSHNGGPLVPALNDDDGWTITVKSALCGINQSKQTDSNGNAEFEDLPLCDDYVVSENPVNAASPGFVPSSPISVGGIQPSDSGNGTSVTFTNVLNTTTPTCTNCPVVPTPTPVTPTVPPTTPPTATPTTKGADPTKTSIVGGEKTPGPGSPTPIAPSTGGGVLGGTAGGFNFALILAGILALTSGLSFVALGRNRRR